MVSSLLFVMCNGQGDPVLTNTTDGETPSLRKTGGVMRKLRTLTFMRYTLLFTKYSSTNIAIKSIENVNPLLIT